MVRTSRERLPSGEIESGIYCVDHRILDYIGEAPRSLEERTVLRLIADGQFEAARYGGFSSM